MKEKKLERFYSFFKKNAVKFIDLKYCSLTGTVHHITLPVNRFAEIINKGVGADGSSLPGYKTVEKGDMLLFPDLGTMMIDSFFKEKTASFICSVFSPDTGEPFHRDSRHIAQKAAAFCKKEMKAELFILPELEFYAFESCDFAEGGNFSYYQLETKLSNEQKPIYPVRHKGGYHLAPPHDRYNDFRNALVSTLIDSKIAVKYHHHEVGAEGQMEIELLFEPLVKCADNIFMSKYLIKCLSRQFGKYVTFMPKPLYEQPGSGLHLHQYLGSRNRSMFFDPDQDNHLSKICLHYIAGILHHSRALCAFTNPSTNSYERLIPGFEAPTYADFAIGSRTTAIRLPAYLKKQRMMDIEYRIPDATANPYLSCAAIALAGIDGIKNKLKVDRKEKLPNNVYEAMRALKDDYKFLLRGDVFSMNLIESWIEVKTKEFEEVHRRPHPYEFILYFGV